MTTLKKDFESITDYLNSLSESELLEFNNIYCQEANYPDDEFFSNDEEFFETFFSGNPFEVARSTFYGDYNFSHDYVKFNGYGNLETTNYLKDWFDFSGVANYILENPEPFNIEFEEESEEA